MIECLIGLGLKGEIAAGVDGKCHGTMFQCLPVVFFQSIKLFVFNVSTISILFSLSPDRGNLLALSIKR